MDKLWKSQTIGGLLKPWFFVILKMMKIFFQLKLGINL